MPRQSPYLNDYGGDQYGRRCRVKRVKQNIRSYRCMDCQKLFYLSHRQAVRRAGVHCPECGGAGDETQASLKRRIGVMKKDGEGPGRKPHVCATCLKRFRSAVGLKLHCEDQHGFYGF